MAEPDYFDLADFRLQPDMTDDEYTDEVVLSSAAYITGIIEREVGTTFIVREYTDTYSGEDAIGIVIRRSFVVGVSSVEIDGEAITETPRTVDGVLYRVDATGAAVEWPAGFGNIEVTYTAGYSAEPPGDVLEAVIKGTRAHVLESASNSVMDSRRTSLSTDMGVLGFSVAGQDNPTGYPEVDSVILGWKRRLFQPSVG